MATDPQLAAEIQRFGQQYVRLARAVRQLQLGQRTSQLENSSIEGTLVITDGDGNDRSYIGVQDDGSITHVDVNAPPPDAPTEPGLLPAVGGLAVTWDGNLTTGAPLADFDHVEVHVSITSGFVPSDTSLNGTINKNGAHFVSGLDPNLQYYAVLIGVNTSAEASDPSAQAGPVQPADASAALAAGSITETLIQDNSISTPKLQAGSVTTAKIVADAITSNELATDSVTADAIAAGSITADEIESQAITAGLIAAGAIDGQTINSLTMNSSKITGTDVELVGSQGRLLVYTSNSLVQVYNVAGTYLWLCPPGVTSILVEGWGAGGGGGFAAGCGGGGGGYFAAIFPVTPGNTYTVTVGDAGASGSSTSNSSDGGFSGFVGDSSATGLAGGGERGTTSNAGQGTDGILSGPVTSGTIQTGGNGASGSGNTGGGGGGSAAPGLDGNNAGGRQGASAQPDGGPGGPGGTAGQPGNDPFGIPGGGGGGGGSNTHGGKGNPGQIRITYTVGTPVLGASAAGLAGTDANSGASYPAGFMGNITAVQPGSAPATSETPHTLSGLSNSWSIGGFWKYWKTAENELAMEAQQLTCTSATTTDGTTVLAAGKLPAGYLPNSSQRFPVYTDLQRLSGSNTEGAGFLILPTGEIQCFGIAIGATRVDFTLRKRLDT